ncbi:MAG: hypothetical protein C0599_13110, partial [Salinivirgaceae bacterium]
MKRIFLLLIAVSLSITIFGQTKNLDYYKYGVSPSELPSYLLNGSPLGSGSIGISDPDLDSAAGAAQAIQRAKAIFYL